MQWPIIGRFYYDWFHLLANGKVLMVFNSNEGKKWNFNCNWDIRGKVLPTILDFATYPKWHLHTKTETWYNNFKSLPDLYSGGTRGTPLFKKNNVLTSLLSRNLGRHPFFSTAWYISICSQQNFVEMFFLKIIMELQIWKC